MQVLQNRAGAGKPGKLRRAAGGVFVVLILAFTVYLSAVMLHKIHSVALAATYRKIFLYELVLCGVLLVFALDLRFDLFTRIRCVPLLAVGWLLRILVAAAAAAILILGGVIAAGGFVRDAGPTACAIVPGMALENGRPTRDLRLRLRTAVTYAEQNPDAVLLLTGGNPDENGRSEAAVMRDLLAEMGFAQDRLLLEEQATDTRENFRNAARMIDPSAPVTLITSGYHMNRAVEMAEDAGFSDVRRLPAPSDPLRYGVNLMWEIILKLDNLMKG